MLVLCPFPVGVAAGQRLKYEQYFDDWRAAGWDIDVSCFMDMGMWNVTYSGGNYVAKILGVLRGHLRRLRDMARIHRYDLVYVFMWVTPFGTSLLERWTRRRARHLIYDVEDNVLVEQSLPAEYNPNYLIRLLKGPGKARFLIRTADHVITSSPFLNDFCLTLNTGRQCTYISSSVDTDRFRPASRSTNDATVTVGWTGTFSSKVFLDLLRDVLRELARRVPYKLKIIGNFDYELDGVDLEVVRWTKEREVEDLQSFDIGIYPLATDDWVLGKSGLKAIQYMAFGLPAVATDVGTTPLLITHGVNGLLVRSDAEWLEALERLIRDPALRRRLGAAARENAVERYSTRAIAGLYRRVLDETMAPAPCTRPGGRAAPVRVS
jgi:glycosyltransferase involved in cell wall biosynthesis